MASRAPAPDVRDAARLFKALGDETRLRIIALLAHGELCVCHIHDALDLPQPNISRHLAVLRAAGVVEDRREGHWVYYRLTSPADEIAESQLQHLTRTFASNDAVRRDLKKLLQMRGPGCR